MEHQGKFVGSVGIAPLPCSVSDICELQKMYFLPEMGSFGMVRELTLHAIKLYESLGFEHIDNALGCTGHGDYEYKTLKAL